MHYTFSGLVSQLWLLVLMYTYQSAASQYARRYTKQPYLLFSNFRYWLVLRLHSQASFFSRLLALYGVYPAMQCTYIHCGEYTLVSPFPIYCSCTLYIHSSLFLPFSQHNNNILNEVMPYAFTSTATTMREIVPSLYLCLFIPMHAI